LERPLIIITNDDGIHSAGLRAAVDALEPLGELLVVAPDRQWSGAGRSMPLSVTSRAELVAYPHAMGKQIRAYAVDATPAICVVYAMLELIARQPAIVVSGINFGENVSTEITISGTVGAALEAATFHVPALAVSLEMAVENHLNGDDAEDYAAAKAYTRRFAQLLIERTLPFDVDVLSINLPRSATVNTPWQLTRLSRHRYFVPTAGKGTGDNHRPGYRIMKNPENAEIGSDIWCLHNAQQVSVTPLSLDLTSRVAFGELDDALRREETT
jgi:5'-nucleotidase